jgi:plasmid stabilization system protein ParE
MATRTYRLAKQAIQDLEAITDTIAEHNLTAAERVLDTLLSCFEFLAENPEAGTSRDDLHKGIRMFVPRSPAENYVVIYYPIRHGIEVSDVIHAKRDWEGMFLRKER